MQVFWRPGAVSCFRGQGRRVGRTGPAQSGNLDACIRRPYSVFWMDVGVLGHGHGGRVLNLDGWLD